MTMYMCKTSSDDEPGDDVVLFDNGTVVDADVYKKVLRRYNWIRENIDDINEFMEKEEKKEKSTSLLTLLRKGLLMSEENASLGGKITDVENKIFNWLFDRISIDLAAPSKCLLFVFFALRFLLVALTVALTPSQS